MTEPDTLDEQIDYLLISLYVGETFMQDNPNWRKQMRNPKLKATATKLKTLFTKHSKELDRLARIDELEECYADAMSVSIDKHIRQCRDKLAQTTKEIE